MQTKFLTPKLRQAAAMRTAAAAPAAIPEFKINPDLTAPDVPTPDANAPTKLTWKDYILPVVAGAGELGGGIAEALALGDEDSGGGNIPSGSSPVGINSPSVGQPFSGRMQLSPQQRQSLALTLLARAR